MNFEPAEEVKDEKLIPDYSVTPLKTFTVTSASNGTAVDETWTATEDCYAIGTFALGYSTGMGFNITVDGVDVIPIIFSVNNALNGVYEVPVSFPIKKGSILRFRSWGAFNYGSSRIRIYPY